MSARRASTVIRTRLGFFPRGPRGFGRSSGVNVAGALRLADVVKTPASVADVDHAKVGTQVAMDQRVALTGGVVGGDEARALELWEEVGGADDEVAVLDRCADRAN